MAAAVVPTRAPSPRTLQTVQTVLRDRSSPMAVILIVRVPNRPSRPKTISIPSVRRKVCARRSRPASARGLFGQPDRDPSGYSIAANIDAELQKVGCAFRPSVGHERAHMADCVGHRPHFARWGLRSPSAARGGWERGPSE